MRMIGRRQPRGVTPVARPLPGPWDFGCRPVEADPVRAEFPTAAPWLLRLARIPESGLYFGPLPFPLEILPWLSPGRTRTIASATPPPVLGAVHAPLLRGPPLRAPKKTTRGPRVFNALSTTRACADAYHVFC
ncbi:hypothetical protein MRX96_030020 [Rhipicephalus microplus]